MAVTAHSWDVIELVKAGVDGIEHIWSVGYSSILDAKKRRELAKQRLAGNIDQELAGAFYEVRISTRSSKYWSNPMSAGHRLLRSGCGPCRRARSDSGKEKIKFWIIRVRICRRR